MNTRIACLLLLAIAHASGTAAPKFPVILKAGTEHFRNNKFNPARSISLAWSPDGKHIVSTGRKTILDNGGRKQSELQLVLWDAVTWDKRNKKILAKFQNEQPFHRNIDFFDPQDSSRFAISPGLGVSIFNLNRPKDKSRVLGDYLGRNFQPFWSTDGKKFAALNSQRGGVRGGVVSVVDVAVDKEIYHLKLGLIQSRAQGGRFNTNTLAWSPDGKMLAMLGRKEIVVYNESLEEEVFRFPLTLGQRFGWSPDGTKLAFSQGDKVIGILDTTEWDGEPEKNKVDYSIRIKETFPGPPDVRITGPRSASVGFFAWGPQSKRIAVSTFKFIKTPITHYVPVLQILHAGTGELLHNFDNITWLDQPQAFPKNGTRSGSGATGNIAWSPDGFKIALGIGDGTIRVFKTPK